MVVVASRPISFPYIEAGACWPKEDSCFSSFYSKQIAEFNVALFFAHAKALKGTNVLAHANGRKSIDTFSGGWSTILVTGPFVSLNTTRHDRLCMAFFICHFGTPYI